MFPNRSLSLSPILQDFLIWAEVEQQHRPQSIVKYKDCARQWQKIAPNGELQRLTMHDILGARRLWIKRELSVARQSSLLLTLKLFLRYCEERKIPASTSSSEIRPLRRPRREVSYLTPEELERVFAAVHDTNVEGSTRISGLRLRALIEALLGSAMRIGELLSLNISDLDFGANEARVIGKGNKQRMVFFTDRAMSWLKQYLDARADSHCALFVTQDGERRLSSTDLWRYFKRLRADAGLTKPFTPHVLRHTAATVLLFNGCPVGHIKEILGHERLETTCRYYLGLDKRAAKQALSDFLLV